MLNIKIAKLNKLVYIKGIRAIIQELTKYIKISLDFLALTKKEAVILYIEIEVYIINSL